MTPDSVKAKSERRVTPTMISRRAVLLVALLTVSNAAGAGSLAWEAVFQQRVTTVRIDKRCFLMVEGLSGNSAERVQRVVLSEEDGTAQIDVTTGLFGSGGSGSFGVVVPLEFPNVRRVTFGPSRSEIWRDKGEKC